MDLKSSIGALSFAGAILFVATTGWGQDAPVLSTAPLVIGATVAAVVVDTEPFVSPLGGLEAAIVSPFGKREAPVLSTSTVAGAPASKMEMHEGADFGIPVGTPVCAAKSGKVIFAGFSKMYVSRTDKKVQHRFVIVRHADGQSSRYVHLSGLRVRPGQEVKASQVLGTVAESDEGKMPVLHFEIRTIQGKAVDPVKVLSQSIKPEMNP